ncbi:hypothetical protein HK27_09095 [Acetobacter orientalis]|uniref:Uncharacterized protein n=1 Tax=Acetobacter orientalis TaxID=146474 RepID=A0A252BB54_9PROT|nr:hypothetical protein HK12_12180 [Acetobacter orientalis]OUJ01590.1 hypothetical protein HK15_07750 [Acetobacter orientalis]OUJ15536.1 hypothetical protein HK27_09095 [Acetobacter orientalis]
MALNRKNEYERRQRMRTRVHTPSTPHTFAPRQGKAGHLARKSGMRKIMVRVLFGNSTTQGHQFRLAPQREGV